MTPSKMKLHGRRLAGVLIGASCALAGAQTRAGQPVNMAVGASGRMLDANPQVGGGGFNAPIGGRVAAPLLGNTIANGSAAGGMALRSYSPISDPLTFRGALGSGTLGAFRRDAVAPLDAGFDSGVYGRTYYDPSTIAPTVGFLRGEGVPGQIAPLDYRATMGVNSQPGLQAQITGWQPPASLNAPLARTNATGPLGASIFGAEAPRNNWRPGVRADELLMPARVNMPGETPPWGASETRSEDAPSPPGGALDLRVRDAQPLLTMIRPELYSRAPASTPPPLGAPLPDWNTQPTLVTPAREPGAAEARTAGAPPPARLADPRVLPGFEVLGDMQMALTLRSGKSAPWFDEMQARVRNDPALARQIGERGGRDLQSFVDQALHAPLRTLAGGGASELNDLLSKAEGLLQIGHFAEAADRYEAAARMEPSNPLPLVGRADAELAAGNYWQAVQALQRAITAAERYPGLAQVLFTRLDLRTLMGGGETVDIRRADLLRRLAAQETPELRFLLGYLEYHSGERDRGLADLRKAAADARASGAIIRYPDLLSEAPSAPESGSSAAPPPAVAAPGLDPQPAARDTLAIPPRTAEPTTQPAP